MSAGCAALRRDRFAVDVVLGVPFVVRRRFLVLLAFSVCSKIFSRPPILAKYSSRISDADSLQKPVSRHTTAPSSFVHLLEVFLRLPCHVRHGIVSFPLDVEFQASL